MNDQLNPKWIEELYKDFPGHKNIIDRLIMSAEHSKDLIRDYYSCKSTIRKVSSERACQKLKDYQLALDALKDEILEFLQHAEE